jgi:hypothetical protein
MSTLGGAALAYDAPMVRPISLRIRSSVALREAHQTLRRVDEADRLQRRVRWQAEKALVAVREMDAVATPRLKAMRSIDRDRWDTQRRLLESILTTISKRGV